MKRIIIKCVKCCYRLIISFFLTLKFFLYVIFTRRYRNCINIVEGLSELTILANGPSLKDIIDKIDYTKGDFSVVNNFYKSPYYKKIKPKYHVLADPLYFRTDEDIRPFVDAVDWDMKLFVPYLAIRNVGVLNKMPNKYIKVVPYNTMTYEGFDCFRNWIYKHGWAMPQAQNVLIPSIFNAINMGYKKICIYGADHSWTETIRVDNCNRVCFTDSHFYDVQKVNLVPWHKSSGEQYLMHEILRDLAQMFDSYHIIRKYADYRNCRILNCTKGSYIDAFERES